MESLAANEVATPCAWWSRWSRHGGRSNHLNKITTVLARELRCYGISPLIDSVKVDQPFEEEVEIVTRVNFDGHTVVAAFMTC